MNLLGLLASLKTLELSTNDALTLKRHSPFLSGFYYNRDRLRAAVANTHVETVNARSDSPYLAARRSATYTMKDALFSMISITTKPSKMNERRLIIAFDYLIEDFYGDRDTL